MLKSILILAVIIAIAIGLAKKLLWLVKVTAIVALVLFILNITGIFVIV